MDVKLQFQQNVINSKVFDNSRWTYTTSTRHDSATDCTPGDGDIGAQSRSSVLSGFSSIDYHSTSMQLSVHFL
uniref:(California timema) hypothetical protein n=1 Tax=Timema californicum TaxID=61474 RepID=A0A7R9J711_TIMCA|nr:unnamed protein product [Timema californicum]